VGKWDELSEEGAQGEEYLENQLNVLRLRWIVNLSYINTIECTSIEVDRQFVFFFFFDN
jgi:hypothetical protein